MTCLVSGTGTVGSRHDVVSSLDTLEDTVGGKGEILDWVLFTAEADFRTRLWL